MQQDDCAPDSLETFERHFPDFAGGLSVGCFKAQALRKEEDISVCWVLGNLELSYSADDPFYTLKFNQVEYLRNRIATLESKLNAVYSERNRLAAGFARMSLSAGFNAGVLAGTESNWPVIYVDSPNGLFSPSNAEGSFVMCISPAGKAAPIYSEPRVITSPFKLPE